MFAIYWERDRIGSRSNLQELRFRWKRGHVWHGGRGGYEYEPPVAGMMKSVYLRSMMGSQPARDPLPKVI